MGLLDYIATNVTPAEPLTRESFERGMEKLREQMSKPLMFPYGYRTPSQTPPEPKVYVQPETPASPLRERGSYDDQPTA